MTPSVWPVLLRVRTLLDDPATFVVWADQAEPGEPAHGWILDALVGHVVYQEWRLPHNEETQRLAVACSVILDTLNPACATLIGRPALLALLRRALSQGVTV